MNGGTLLELHHVVTIIAKTCPYLKVECYNILKLSYAGGHFSGQSNVLARLSACNHKKSQNLTNLTHHPPHTYKKKSGYGSDIMVYLFPLVCELEVVNGFDFAAKRRM